MAQRPTLAPLDMEARERLEDLRAANYRWRGRPKLGEAVAEAAAFVREVGLCYLFPAPKHLMPSLWDAVTDDEVGWEPFGVRIWSWRTELGGSGAAHYSKWFGRAGLVAPDLLVPWLAACALPGTGATRGDRLAALGSPSAEAIAKVVRVLLEHGPISKRALRKLGGWGTAKADIKELDRAIALLYDASALVSTGAVDDGNQTGWESALLSLVEQEAPDQAAQALQLEPAAGAERVLSRYLASAVVCSPSDAASALHWPRPRVTAALASLAATGAAVPVSWPLRKGRGVKEKAGPRYAASAAL